MNEYKGLTSIEAKKRLNKGLGNKSDNIFSPSYISIVLRNTFSIMHIILLPLIFAMIYFQLMREGIVFTIFIVVNSITNSLEEIRIKKRLFLFYQYRKH